MAVELLSWLTAIFVSLTSLNPSIFPFPSFYPSPSISIPPSPPSIISLPSLSLNLIFSDDHSWTNQLPAQEIITLITTGDVIPARSVNWKMTEYNDFTYPFQKTADFLKSSDLTLINLESPLIDLCPVTQEGMVFCGSQRFIEGLKFADIDVVNLANNHSLNLGKQGLCQTVELLTKNNILVCGLPHNFSCLQSQLSQPPQNPQSYPNLSITTIKGLKIGFLGFNLLDPFDQLDLLTQVRQAKSRVDFLVVSFHWGAEYQRYPAPETINFARQVVDAGADLIVGNHPHWYQPIEIYKGKPILYAHGNFIFDQEWSQETKIGFLAKHLIYKGKVVDLQIFPIFIHDYSQAYFPDENLTTKVLKDLQTISNNLNINY